MKISDSMLSLRSAHQRVTRNVERESLQFWQRGGARSGLEREGPGVGALRRRAMALLQSQPPVPAPVAQAGANEAVANGDEALDAPHELRIMLMKLLVERFTGHSIAVLTPADLKGSRCMCEPSAVETVTAANEPSGEGWGLIYQNYQSHYEAERTSFHAQGVVRTADGQEIVLDLQLTMSREFFSAASTTLRAGAALKDPLVVNFSGQAAELTQQRYAFDIDADGALDQVRFVTPQSGFLALDGNGDGVINDGSELFGAQSGNGFAELARFDADGNGWIDENDPVFDRLRIWSKDAQGGDQLVALGAKGIGAIYLGHVTTPFELKDSQNTQLGAVRESGLYLTETGSAGTLQQIDLVV